MLNSYVRELQAKLKAEINQQQRISQSAEGPIKNKANKMIDMLRQQVSELEDYERNVLYPLVSRNMQIDLDDGVLVNYLRFGKAVVKIPAIEKKRAEVKKWTWPTHPLSAEDGA